jgi:hypothetical protein
MASKEGRLKVAEDGVETMTFEQHIEGSGGCVYRRQGGIAETDSE